MLIDQLVYNLAVLVAASVLSGFVEARWSRKTIAGKILQGITFGLIAILAMLNPFKLSEGIIFDGRSIVLSLSALFFGPVSGVIAGAMAIATRIILGLISGGSSGGIIVGVSVITSSILIGLLANFALSKKYISLNVLNLYLFGIVVHVAMLVLIAFLPNNAFQTVAISIILFYPIATVLIGKMLLVNTERELAITALQKSEERNRAIVESTSDWIWELDKDGKYCYCSGKIETILGYTPEEIIGLTPFELIAAEERGRIETAFQNVYNNKEAIVDLENWNIHKDGHRVCLMSNVIPIIDELGKVIGCRGADKDITERWQAGVTLLESQKELQGIFENAPIGIFHSTIEGHFLTANPTLIEMLGYTDFEELITETSDMGTQIYADNMQRPKIIDALTKNDGWVHYDEVYWRKKDGGRIMVDMTGRKVLNAAGEIAYFEGFIKDVTESKRVAAELARAQIVLENTFEQSPIPMILISMPDAVIRIINPACREHLGMVDERSWVGVSLYEFKASFADYDVNGKLKTLEDLPLARCLRGIKTINQEGIVVRKDGSSRWQLITGTPIYNANGEIIAGYMILTDITERKNAENDLLVAKDKAEEMNHLKTNFLANMSHELRTPLNGILGYASILSSELEKAEHIGMAEGIYRSGRRLNDTLNFILDLSAAETDKMEVLAKDIAIVPIVNNSVHLLAQEAAKRNLHLEIVIQDENIFAHLDEHLLIRVLHSLLDNAMKFTKEGTITVEAEKQLRNGTDWFTIKVRDTGIGITRENIDLIWDEFRQVSEGMSRNYEGAGLGLTISKKAVELMHGEISVESEFGVGSIFTIAFPALASMPESAKPEIQAAEIKSHKIPTGSEDLPVILYVEDDFLNRDIVKQFLKNTCRLETAENGEAALQLILENKYDLFLMDINLGEGIDGMGVVHEILKIPKYAGTPIVAVTSYAMENEKREFLSGGCSHYLPKPFTKQELVDMVTSALSE